MFYFIMTIRNEHTLLVEKTFCTIPQIVLFKVVTVQGQMFRVN